MPKDKKHGLHVAYIPFFHRFEEPSSPRQFTRLRRSRVATYKLAQKLAEILRELISRSSLEPMDAEARGLFLHEINRAVAALDGMVLRQIELWKPLAQKSVQWPMLVTLNPRIAKEQKQLLEALELGRDSFISMKPRSRTSTNDAATRYALSILQTLNDNRDSWSELIHPTAPQWAKDAGMLSPFTKTTWHSWWLLGKQALLEVHPHPEEIEELKKLAHTKTTPAEKRALILERIARAVRSLAPTR